MHYANIRNSKKGNRYNDLNRRGKHIRVSKDRYGRVKRVGDIFLTYDSRGKIRRIGSVVISYNRGQLKQVGGLTLIYNRRGHMINTRGFVNHRNKHHTSKKVYRRA